MEEKEKVNPTEETSSEQDTEETEETEATTEESEESSQDIDYKKELETLEEAPKGKSEKEKAIYTARSLKKRLEALDVDTEEIAEIFGVKPKPAKKQEEQKEVSADDIESRIEARLEVKRLARSDDEAKVMLWWVVNKGLSVSDAHILANKGRIKTFLDEQKRGNVRTEAGGTASGRKGPAKAPELSLAEQKQLLSMGFVKKPDGSFEGKKMRVFYDTASRKWTRIKK